MKKFMSVAVAFLVVAGFLRFPAVSWAQAKPIKGAIVFLKVPYSCFKVTVSSWTGYSTYNAAVKTVENGITINLAADWRLSGFPPMTEYKVKKVKTDSQTGATEVELESDTLPNVKLTFGRGKATELFPQVVATKDEVDAYRKEAYALLATKFFDGTPLAGLSDSQKMALCMFANVTANGTKLGSVTYKENLYLFIDIGSDGNVYNDLKLNQVQRVAHVINERLLAVLKAFTIPVKDEMKIYGLKLEFVIPHRSFADESKVNFNDKLEIYAPIDLILQFADADITSQQFIDGCVVIVEGNRISVPLASS
jgi:hypothetical protein